jgi:hypothetical protein
MPRRDFFWKAWSTYTAPAKANRVDGPVGVAVEVIHDLQHACPAKAPQRLGERRLQAKLRIPKRAANAAPNLLRERPQVLPAAADPAHRLGPDIYGTLHHPDLPPIYACSGITSRSFVGQGSLYRSLSPGAKPRYDTVLKVLHSLGVKLTVSVA